MITYLIIILLVSLSALFSGMTLGLMSLGKADLERKIKLGDKNAVKIYRVRRKGNLLLCTLLLGNVAVNSTLSIFLGGIATGVVAGFIATGLIVVLGEIMPQAACSRHAYIIGARLSWLVEIFIYIFYPVCAPLAWILDKALGEEMATIWSRKELINIIQEHEDSDRSDIDADEERIMMGALSFSEKKAADIMTPRTVVLSLSADTILNAKMLNGIKNHGFTRIPVYEKTIDNMVGILYAKDLIGLSVRSNTSLRDIYRRNSMIKVGKDAKLDYLLNELIKQKNHLAFVYNDFGGFEGLVSLEDLTEEIFRLEIVDESDRVRDLREEARLRSSEQFKQIEV